MRKTSSKCTDGCSYKETWTHKNRKLERTHVKDVLHTKNPVKSLLLRWNITKNNL